jgi:hypothetical protein
MMKYAKGRWQKWVRAATQQAGAARGQAAPPVCEPALWLLSPPPFGLFSLLAKYNFLVFFGISRSSEIWCLDSHFSSRILTPAANPPIIIKHVKIEETT